MSGRQRVARVLMYGGIVVVVAAMSKVHAAYIANPPYDFTGSFRFAWALAFMALLAVAAYGMGLPDLPRTVRSAFLSAVAGAVLAAVAMSLLQLAVGDALLPRFVVASSALLLVPWYVVCVAVAAAGRVDGQERDQIVVVAERAEAETMHDDISCGPERPAAFAGSIAPAEATSTAPTDAAGPTSGLPLLRFVEERGGNVVVLSRDAQANESVVAQAAVLHGQGVRIRTVSLFYEEWLAKLPLSELERTSLMFDIGELHRQRYTRGKRVLDLVFGLAGLVALLVLIPIVFVLNLISNRGSLFYRQPRVGKNGEIFEILKFRTMRAADGDEAGGEWTAEDDPRITPFGRLLRRSHLDELPQVWNILRGDLSVVGPRPEQPRYVEELVAKLPFYDMRHLIRPGLTGWAQVKYGYAGDESDAVEKLQYEFYYLRRQSLALDLRIVGRTVRSVLGRQGR